MYSYVGRRERDTLKVQEKPVLLRARLEWNKRRFEIYVGIDSAKSE